MKRREDRVIEAFRLVLLLIGLAKLLVLEWHELLRLWP